jgi:thiol-disulfide isomerase/thioredoxin
MIALAAGLALDLPATLQRLIPDYTASLQDQLRPSAGTPLDLGGLVTDENRGLANCTQGATSLQDCGAAPALRDATAWIGSQPLDLKSLHGKVVLIDFWAYSCINCQRSLPHIVQLNDAYKAAGLEVIGIHTPEYAFEREQRNVEAGVKEHGIDYPVAMDNSYATWTAYRNRFWPAQYLIDANGTVRHIQQGEGGYQTTEDLVRQLLSDAHPGIALPKPVESAGNAVAAGTTPETFLGVAKQTAYAGTGDYRTGPGTFAFPAQQRPDSFALSGAWTLDAQRIVAGSAHDAGASPAAAGSPSAAPNGAPSSGTPSVRLNFTARQVQAVVGGTGTLMVKGPDGERTVEVGGTPRSYVLLDGDQQRSGTLEAVASPGVELYSFTFG